MKVYVGTDIIEVNRIKKAMQDSEFANRVFTDNEIKYCESKSENTKYQHYAARFAAKEAIFKAISTQIDDKYAIGWKDIEIVNNENGRPIVHILNDKENITYSVNDKTVNNLNIDVSISHLQEYAMATAVVTIN